jgi:hypothetical protein
MINETLDAISVEIRQGVCGLAEFVVRHAVRAVAALHLDELGGALRKSPPERQAKHKIADVNPAQSWNGEAVTGSVFAARERQRTQQIACSVDGEERFGTAGVQ